MTKPQKKDDTGELLVSIEQFRKTRDSVIVSLTSLQSGLAHVQNGITELLRAYISHTASILNNTGETVELQMPPQFAYLQAHQSLDAVQQMTNAVSGAAPEADKKKEKKRKRAEKKQKDPNAPKRPLTAAFLFAQQARPIVRRDLEDSLGPDQKLEPNAVNVEVTKRWNELPEEEKEKWKASYRDSQEKYKVELAAYLASKGEPVQHIDLEMHDAEDEPATDDPEAETEAAAVEQSDSEDDSEDEASPAPITKQHTPPAANSKTPRTNKRQKTSHQTPMANGSHVPIAPAVASHTPVPAPVFSQKSVVPAPSSAVPDTPASTKKEKKKKEKSVPQPIAPAPAKEPSPEESKKKSAKNGRATRSTEAEAEEPVAETKKEKKEKRKRKSEAAA